MVRTQKSGDGPQAPRVTNLFTVVPDKMTIPQLQQGINWLLWQLYRPAAYAERMTAFLERYEQSPRRPVLRIPRGIPGRRELGVLARLARYGLTGKPGEEKATLKALMKVAGRSSHPHAPSFVVGGFITAEAIRAQLRADCPNIAGLPYPRPEA